MRCRGRDDSVHSALTRMPWAESHRRWRVVFSAGAAERGSQAPEEEESLNYEEKAQEIVQSILQEVVSTVAGGELPQSWLVDLYPGVNIIISNSFMRFGKLLCFNKYFVLLYIYTVTEALFCSAMKSGSRNSERTWRRVAFSYARIFNLPLWEVIFTVPSFCCVQMLKRVAARRWSLRPRLHRWRRRVAWAATVRTSMLTASLARPSLPASLRPCLTTDCPSPPATLR